MCHYRLRELNRNAKKGIYKINRNHKVFLDVIVYSNFGL